jgi:three-Cys-motif partner protein
MGSTSHTRSSLSPKIPKLFGFLVTTRAKVAHWRKPVFLMGHFSLVRRKGFCQIVPYLFSHNMAQRRFGSADSTGRKLDVIEEYLSVYQRALSNTGFQTLYIDGFAGSGEVPLGEHEEGLFDEDVKSVLAGSADRALNTSPPFSRYIFIDKRRKCIDAISAKFKDRQNVDRVTYIVGDANEKIRALCSDEQWRAQRGVVLLDPFGSQVEWTTIEAIAATRSLDLWYLFPAGVSVFRQIANAGTVHGTHVDAITRIFGSEDWSRRFLRPPSNLTYSAKPPGKRRTSLPKVRPSS